MVKNMEKAFIITAQEANIKESGLMIKNKDMELSSM